MSASRKLLIIDDDPDFVAAMKAILVRAGYDVDAANDPKTGFERLENQAYDLLLLDIMMGRGAEGVALARKIGRHPRLREMPILIITGIREQIAFLFPGQPVHPHFVPVDELLEKPVEPALLLEKVAHLLQLSADRKAQEEKG